MPASKQKLVYEVRNSIVYAKFVPIIENLIYTLLQRKVRNSDTKALIFKLIVYICNIFFLFETSFGKLPEILFDLAQHFVYHSYIQILNWIHFWVFVRMNFDIGRYLKNLSLVNLSRTPIYLGFCQLFVSLRTIICVYLTQRYFYQAHIQASTHKNFQR